MPEFKYHKFLSPVDKDSGNSAATRQQTDGHTNAQQLIYIEELKKVNEELKLARRAALNFMEDAIASKEALRKSEEKYRTKLEQDVTDRTAELNATKENLQATLDSSLDIIQVFKAVRDSMGKIVDFTWEMNNKLAVKQNGEVIGESLLHKHPGLIPSGIFEKMIEVTETGTPHEQEQYYNYEQFDGWFYQALVKSGDGVVMTTRNITEQKKAAHELLHLKEEIAQKAADKYSRLFNTMEEGFAMIDLIRNEDGKCVNYIYSEANPAFEKLVGLKPEEVVGKPALDLFPTLDDSWVQIFGNVADQQQSTRFEHHLKENGRWYEVLAYPVSDDHVAVLYNNITQRKIAEIALRESEERKEFLLKLNDTIRQLNDPVEIQYEAARLVAEQLGADRVHFAELSDEKLVIRKDYVRANAPSVAGAFKAEDIAASLKLNRDEPVVIPDTQDFPLLSDEEKAAFAAAKIRSQLSVALSKMGKKVASFSVDQTTPRQWTPLEISILQEAAERTWGAVERAKAEEASRESEALLAKELEDTRTLQKISSRIIEEGNVDALYQALINSATELMHSDCASIQILNPEGNQLKLAASKGFHPASAEFWKYVRAGSTTTCGKALERETRVVISDIDKWSEVSKEDLDAYHRSGIVATQSTPLISRSGKCVGMMSTHWKKVFQPSQRKLGLFELLARQVADVIERKQAEEALMNSKERLQKAIQIETVGVLFFNDDGLIVEANNAFLKMTGYTSEQVNNAEVNIKDITPHEWIPAMKNAMQEVIATGIATPYERELLCADGSRLWALCAKARISENDNIEYIIDVTKRREAEEGLRQNEERFRTLTNAVPQVIWTNDATGKANFFNERWYKYSGLNYDESVGLGWEAIVHPADAPASKELWQKALAAGKIFDTEYRLRKYDGEYRWHIGRNIPLKNKEGKITSWFGSATEIEELKQTENALRESEAKMKITFESATDFAIITIDKDCHIETWNSGAEKIFGYNEDEIKGKSCNLIFTPEDIADYIPEKEMKRARETGHAADDRWHVRRNGERFFASGVTSPIYDNNGLSGYVKVARDMTEKREAEENLRIWEERYRIALLSAEMGAWDWDIPEDKLIWNEQQYVLLGLPPDHKEKTLNDFLQFVLNEDKEQLTRNLQTAKKGNDVFQMEFRIKRADNNEIRWMNKFGLVVTKKDNRAARMIGVMYDITERKRLEQQKEDFIGIASHELKTPVTSIKAYTELLQQICNAGDYAAGVPLVPKLSAQVDRLIELVHTLLDISKMADGELPLTIEEFDLKQLAEESAESLQRTTSLCSIIIQPKKEILIHADRERISQVLTNLISNAVKYSPNGGDVIINWQQTPEGIEVSVRDEGIGISKEMQAKVFDRFFRVRDVKANTFPGMGLGLYIIRNLVRRHGGRIWVESEPDKGSVFYFILPGNKQAY